MNALTRHEDDAVTRDEAPVDVDVDEVLDRAAVVRKPYANEAEKQAVLARLKKTGSSFDEMIGETTRNIRDAEERGSRSEKELQEAKQALAEMHKGRDFIQDRITIVEKDEL